MINKIAIYGAGGFGREMALMISQINEAKSVWNVIGFFDDGLEKGLTVDDLNVLGGINELNAFTDEVAICVAVADPITRKKIISSINNNKVDFPILIHPMANIGDKKRNKIGRGSIVTAESILTTGISLGEFCIINLSVTIGHDVNLGECCTVMPACSISGNVDIGSSCLLGTGSRIIQGIKIGESCTIGAGAVVTKSFGDNKKIMGVPARSI